MNNKLAIFLLAFASCLLALSCIQEETRPADDAPKGNSFVRITHTSSRYVLPVISGQNFSAGSVQWGDGSSEEYVSGLEHIYSRPGEHTVVIGVYDPAEIVFNGVEDIADIDLSSF